MLKYQRNPAELLSQRIKKVASGCWEYQGTINSNGYGQLAFAGRRISTHRLSWMLFNGPIPDGLFACHRCDNKKCVNPEHLYVGTHQDNMKDAVERRRWPNHLSKIQIRKISPGQREQIKDLYLHFGLGVTFISKIYGTGRTTIYSIINGETHKRFLQI